MQTTAQQHEGDVGHHSPTQENSVTFPAREQSQHAPGAETPERSTSARIDPSLHLLLRLPLQSHLRATHTQTEGIYTFLRVEQGA
ncbi:hypothetical protein AV530_004371 [Patagioenas fasciata monilis]|uniref:Uncharacterized protein n=1 Tax=Patagioenas fasciata monilis TaxID=372326 RepID=A0A1V4K9G1_PATFA|nr:hypothetical protein AV530_004371 [Patagioenas fasciata monilis]